MNKTAIKNYTTWARRALIEGVKQKAFEYGIEKDKEIEVGLSSISGRILSNEEKNQRKNLIEEIKNKGFNQVIEEISYTWFNRFIALRYMEVNGYLPSKVRVFSNEEGKFDPEIIKEALNLNFENIDKEIIYKYIENNDNENLFKYLIIAQCNELGKSLPFMFEKISDYTELLFPNNLLREDSVIGRLVKDIDEDDWKNQVQIIGWIYQYYISEVKDDTFAKLKKNIKISKERIPAATQLFTPEWIVKYMVQNSLGRLWYEGHRNFDKSNWKYYIDEAEQEDEVEEKLKEIRKEYSTIKPEEIKLIDPSMGSGHILAYAFDVLMEIYISQGWRERDAAISILENNIYGLDIDERAGQLAYFSLMMKAREYNRRILNKEVETNILTIIDSSFMDDNFIQYFSKGNMEIEEELNKLKDTFRNAKDLGSITIVPDINYEIIDSRIKDIIDNPTQDVEYIILIEKVMNQFINLVKQAKFLSMKYDVVITNPPYMGSKGMNPILDKYVKKNYPKSKRDLFAVFIELGLNRINDNRFLSLITMQSWMFLSSFESLRLKILDLDIVNLLQLGTRAFDEIGGEVVQTASYILRNSKIKDYKSDYVDLKSGSSEVGKEKEFFEKENYYTTKKDNFNQIPGSPIAYWASDRVFEIFRDSNKIEDYLDVKQGLATADNNRFLRLWWEVDENNVYYNAKNNEEFIESKKKWAPINKGGARRQWYGNYDYLINWENNGYEIKNFKDDNGKQRSVIRNPEYYFREAITWGMVTSGKFSIRYRKFGSIYNNAGMAAFSENKLMLKYIMGALGTKISDYLLNILNPTLNLPGGVLEKFPIINIEKKESIIILINNNINISKKDWDSYEDSWDFKRHPLI